jgi:hypothetical protein
LPRDCPTSSTPLIRWILFEALTLDPAEEVERTGLHVVDPAWEPNFDDIGD